ncbi:na+ dependent nucleoside transporter family protein, partial [Vibrio parahaemolyticus IDH02640]
YVVSVHQRNRVAERHARLGWRPYWYATKL